MTRLALVLFSAAALAPRALAAPTATAAPDRSLTPAEYVAAGLPATDREWNPSDYVRAHEALAALVSERGVTVLPRFESPRSGPVFARIADRSSFKMVADRSFAIEARLPVVLQGAQGVVNVLKLYLQAQGSAAGGMSPELVDLSCLTLHAGRRMAEVVADVAPPAPGSPERGKFDEGMGQVRSGLATAIQGSFTTLSDRTLDPRSRTRFAGCVADEVAASMPHLTPQMQAEVRNQVRRAVAAEPPDSAVTPPLARLAAAVAPAR